MPNRLLCRGAAGPAKKATPSQEMFMDPLKDPRHRLVIEKMIRRYDRVVVQVGVG
jgi:hypothetical protein